MASTKQPDLILGPIKVTQGPQSSARMAILLWGAATCGKSTLAATSPGTKLWLSFGDQEHVSVMGRPDVLVANLAELGVDELFKHAQSDNPFGLDKLLSDNAHIETVVCDSLTAISFRALQKSVGDKVGAGRGFTPSMETPGISAYGGRNAIVLEVVQGLLRITSKHGVHLIITAHEDDPTMVPGQENVIDYVSVMLGGKLVNNMTWRLSEIWYMSQETTGERNRKLMVRPARRRKPVKTRMFTLKGEPEFVLHYDPDLPDEGQHTIASWFDEWKENEFQKIEIPVEPEELPKAKKALRK